MKRFFILLVVLLSNQFANAKSIFVPIRLKLAVTENLAAEFLPLADTSIVSSINQNVNLANKNWIFKLRLDVAGFRIN